MFEEVMLAAFEDELEKIAGVPRAVADGGGGLMGRLLRKANKKGRAASVNVAKERAWPKPTLKDQVQDLFLGSGPVSKKRINRRLGEANYAEGKKAKRAAQSLVHERSLPQMKSQWPFTRARAEYAAEIRNATSPSHLREIENYYG